MATEGSWESTGATIGRTVADSAPSFDRGVDPGPAAPNVVIVLLDDTGFSQLGCFGSDIDTSNIGALTRRHHIHQLSCHPVVLAHSGCAPHRTISTCGWDAGRIELEDRLPTPTWPHLSTCSNDSRSAPLTWVRTFCAGKWHLAPTSDISAAGPLINGHSSRLRSLLWLSRGRNRPIHPELVRDNSQVSPPRSPEEGTTSRRILLTTCLRWSTTSRVFGLTGRFCVPSIRCHPCTSSSTAQLHAEVPRAVRRGWDVIANAGLNVSSNSSHSAPHPVSPP